MCCSIPAFTCRGERGRCGAVPAPGPRPGGGRQLSAGGRRLQLENSSSGCWSDLGVGWEVCVGKAKRWIFPSFDNTLPFRTKSALEENNCEGEALITPPCGSWLPGAACAASPRIFPASNLKWFLLERFSRACSSPLPAVNQRAIWV